MKTMKSPYACLVAICLSALLCNPNEIMASPDTPQRAGVVSRVIPAVSIARGAKSISASANAVVDWQDVVSTQASARARVALDDGSVLNVGSDSSIKVVKHDGGAQQTELELTFEGASLLPEALGNPVGDPRELLVWFVNHCAAMGITIEPEWTITTGSYVGAHRIGQAGIVHGHIDGLGEVEIELT